MRFRARGIGTFKRLRQAVFALAFIAAAAGAGPAEAAGATQDATDFIRLAPIEIPIIVNRQVVGEAGVLVQVQLADPRDFDAVNRQRTRLADAFFTELYGLFGQFAAAGHRVDPEIIKQHLTRVADRMVGAGKVREVVILRSFQPRNLS